MDKRREQLELWRKKTGRTPMKRLSYVQPCYIPPGEKNPTALSSVRTHRVYPRTEVKKLRKRDALLPVNENSASLPRSNASTRHRPVTDAERQTMKEAFQRDIDDTVAEILAEEADTNLARGLSFEDSFCSTAEERLSPVCPVETTPKSVPHLKRRSSVYYVDQSLAFESSKICYTLISSEYRGRKRMQRLFRDDTDAGKKLLYLTPVRRTSRRSRSICPQLVPKGETCFTSPSELSEREGYDGVEVLRNEALEVLQPSRPLVGANCSQRGAELES